MACRRDTKPDRLRGFSDGVFAVIITITLLGPALRPQESSSFGSLCPLWPPTSVRLRVPD